MYDRWQRSYGRDYTSLIFPRLLRTIRSCRLRPSVMLDLGCGTGTLALAMAARGWKVWGVDASEGMLAEAARKLNSRSGSVSLLRQDMHRLRLPERVDLATSLFDTLNHLTTRRALAETFRRVHDSLNPGGCFVFDTNNDACFRNLWTQTDTVTHRDFTLILRNSYDPGRGIAVSSVVLFLREGDRFRRETETVRERCYDDEDVERLLLRAGFIVRRREPFNLSNLPQASDLKTWWVAERPA